MKKTSEARRKTASTASSASAATVPSTVSLRAKNSEERDGTATPRQKQRAAQRVAALPPTPAKASPDTNSVSARRKLADAAPASSCSTAPGAPLQTTHKSDDGDATSTHVGGITVSNASSTTTTRVPTAAASAAPMSDVFVDSAAVVSSSASPPAQGAAASAGSTKPARRHTSPSVVLRRPPTRTGALSPRHITLGANLATPPPPPSASSPASAVALPSSSASSNPSRSPRNTANVVDGWTPRTSSSSIAAQDRRISPARVPSPSRTASGATTTATAPTPSAVVPLQRISSQRRGSYPANNNNNSSSSARSHTAQTSHQRDGPRMVTATHRPRNGPPSVPAQQLLDEGYYLVSDGSANSSFSDTPRSARPVSISSSLSRRASMHMLDGAAASRAAVAAVAAGTSSNRTPTTAGPGGSVPRRDSSSEGGSSSCSSSNSSGRRRLGKRRNDDDSSSSSGSNLELYDGDANFDEEDEEQAVLTYMDSGADISYPARPSGSTHRQLSPSSPARLSHHAHRAPPAAAASTNHNTAAAAISARSAAAPASSPVGDGDELDLSVELGPTDRDDAPDGAPGRLSFSASPSLFRRGGSVARETRGATPTRTRSALATTPTTTSPAGNSGSGSGRALANTPPQPSPLLSAKPAPAALSRQHSTTAAAAAQASLRRSPNRNAATPPSVQPSPLNPFAQPPYSPAASPDDEVRERQCKHLSLHEAFFFNQSRSFWLVDDQVLAKVLEYVRLMGYEHPALKRDRSKGQPSLWSSSSAISSPIAPGKLKKKTTQSPSTTTTTNAAAPAAPTTSTTTAAPLPKELNGKAIPNPLTSPSAAAAAVAEAVVAASPAAAATDAAAANGASATSPYAFLGKQFHLRSGKPRCAGQYANTTSTSATHLFLTFNEALRWIVEQEYVIGTVLMCCARFIGDAEADGATIIGDGTADGAAWHPRRAMLQRGKPCIPVRLHPIHFVASLVMAHYPQWGGMAAFMRTWETQIRLVLGSAAPAHQRVFKCLDDGLLLSSDLDAGNLHRVERAPEPYFFLIWLEPDNGSDKRIWFRFSVAGAKEGRTLRFRLMNAAPHAKLYRQNGMMPVWRDGLSQVNWGPVDSCSFRTTNHDLDGEVCFSIQARNSTETIQIAFCAPYSYADLLCHVCHWHALVKNSGCDIRFEERVLCRSPEGRKLHLLIVTSRAGGPPKSSRAAKRSDAVSAGGNTATSGTGASTSAAAVGGVGGGGGSGAAGAAGSSSAAAATGSTSAGAAAKTKGTVCEVIHGPYSNFSSGKKVVLVSGRVHPGEVTASHGVHGLISFLLSSDPRALQLREHFIFFIVPMLNPDGVSRGHSRLDQYGSNLNRCYNDPDPETQPTVLALRRVFEHLQSTYRERFIMYLDFHSHASQSSGFMFGNNLPVRVQHWNVFFPRLVELHARHVFSFGLCRFGRVHMTSKDGASRVLFGSSLIHSYTVELTHFTDRRLYADDFAAMNNGGDVLFEVTWPPPPHASGVQSSNSNSNNNNSGNAANGDDEQENSRSGLRGNAGSPTVRTSSSAPGFAGGGRGGKRTNSTTAGHGKSTAAAGTRARAASVTAGAKHAAASVNSTAGKGGDGTRKRGASVGVGERAARGQSKDSVHSAASPLRVARGGPALQPVAAPSVLCQSAEVGRACLLALLDYCSIGRQSEELTAFGGMNRVLRDVKRQMKPATSTPTSKKAKKSQAATTYAGIEPIYKQY